MCICHFVLIFNAVFQAVQEVSHNYNNLSAMQRKFVAVNTKDIFLRFIYEIGMIFDDETRTSSLLLFSFSWRCSCS